MLMLAYFSIYSAPVCQVLFYMEHRSKAVPPPFLKAAIQPSLTWFYPASHMLVPVSPYAVSDSLWAVGKEELRQGEGETSNLALERGVCTETLVFSNWPREPLSAVVAYGRWGVNSPRSSSCWDLCSSMVAGQIGYRQSLSSKRTHPFLSGGRGMVQSDDETSYGEFVREVSLLEKPMHKQLDANMSTEGLDSKCVSCSHAQMCIKVSWCPHNPEYNSQGQPNALSFQSVMDEK